jgi:CMP-N,N'-diacetyllegionaminic acid synthase
MTRYLPKDGVIGCIPARAGSERIPNKNIKSLDGKPLIVHSIVSALEADIFSEVIVSTDSKEIAEIACDNGAKVPFLRPRKYATSTSPDIDWLYDLLSKLGREKGMPPYFSILRPTNPFRRATTIRNAWIQFKENLFADSLRAVQLCSEHPYKMWQLDSKETLMYPLFSQENSDATPWHSSAYQVLPKIYIQNASLEFAPVSAVLNKNRITGEKVMPFIMESYEGFDINRPIDWLCAEILVKSEF